VGTNDTQRLFNMADRAGSLVGKLGKGDVGVGSDVEIGNTLISTRNALLERQHSIVADIANEQQRQNIEAGKALMMAGRSEQLQAAMMQRYLGEKGQMSPEKFMFMSPETRRVAKDLVPGVMPPGMDRLGELQREKKQLDTGMPEMLNRIESVLKGLRDDTKIAPPPQVNINVDVAGGVVQFMDRIESVVKADVNRQFDLVNSRLDQFLAFMEPGGGVV